MDLSLIVCDDDPSSPARSRRGSELAYAEVRMTLEFTSFSVALLDRILLLSCFDGIVPSLRRIQLGPRENAHACMSRSTAFGRVVLSVVNSHLSFDPSNHRQLNLIINERPWEVGKSDKLEGCSLGRSPCWSHRRSEKGKTLVRASFYPKGDGAAPHRKTLLGLR